MKKCPMYGKEYRYYHVPVLLKESVDGLNISSGGIYVDATFGGGSHSKEILSRLGEKGCLFGIDQDEDAEKNMFSDRRFTFIRSNFRYLVFFMDWYNIQAIDGILADLGVSSHHLDNESRGFSYRFVGNLDMRMNRREGMTAADILNTYSEEQLTNILFSYGELKNAHSISKAVVQARNKKDIQTIEHFLTILCPFVEEKKEKKQLSQIFQSLRIEVNKEMDALKEMLAQANQLLKSGGRMAVITYHSLEDRLVKSFFKTGNFDGRRETDFYGNAFTPFKLMRPTFIIPHVEEIKRNPRSRSAKLRIVEKI